MSQGLRRRWFFAFSVLLPPVGLGLRGLAVRHVNFALGFAPDVLWALLVYCLVVVLWPRASLARSGVLALGVAWSVELGQLIRWPWLVALRATRVGGLLLGTTFLWSDMASYAVGVMVGLALDWGLRRWSCGGSCKESR